MEKKQILYFLIAISIIVIIVIIYDYRGEQFVKRLVKNGQLTTGQITSIDFDIKHGYEINFTFTVGYKDYYQHTSRAKFTRLQNAVINKRFPVMYNRSEPSICEMIITPDDFKEFNIPFPDSLKWVKNILHKN